MVISVSETTDRLVKSAERVQNLGEVLTPPETVKAMLDALPRETWSVHPSTTFFEPGCGDGNFLVEVLERKFQRISECYDAGMLPGGSDLEALQFHMLEALSSIYGVDICTENILGSTNPKAIGTRQRLFDLLSGWYASVTGAEPDAATSFLLVARWIVERNILVADMLKVRLGTKERRNPEAPLVEYEWDAEALEVAVRATSLEESLCVVAEEAAGMLSLAQLESSDQWTVHPLKLQDVPIAAPRVKRRKARNGSGWRTA